MLAFGCCNTIINVIKVAGIRRRNDPTGLSKKRQTLLGYLGWPVGPMDLQYVAEAWWTWWHLMDWFLSPANPREKSCGRLSKAQVRTAVDVGVSILMGDFPLSISLNIHRYLDIGFSTINHPFWGILMTMETSIFMGLVPQRWPSAGDDEMFCSISWVAQHLSRQQLISEGKTMEHQPLFEVSYCTFLYIYIILY